MPKELYKHEIYGYIYSHKTKHLQVKKKHNKN